MEQLIDNNCPTPTYYYGVISEINIKKRGKEEGQYLSIAEEINATILNFKGSVYLFSVLLGGILLKYCHNVILIYFSDVIIKIVNSL